MLQTLRLSPIHQPTRKNKGERAGTAKTRGVRPLIGSSTVSSADADFDSIALGRWKAHLDMLRRNGEKPRVWGSNYWREWMHAVDLFADGDVDDICVADVEECVGVSAEVDTNEDDSFCGPTGLF